MRARSLPLLLGLVAVLVTACSSTTEGTAAGPATPKAPGPAGTEPAAPACPVAPIAVVVTVDQWSDIVQRLAGACGETKTIISGSSVNPHDYEPTAADTAAFGKAALVVLNGAGYDSWAEKALESSATKPAVVDGGRVTGRQEGENPHLWYSPMFVDQISSAVTAELTRLAPAAAPYFQERAAAWTAARRPYHEEIAKIEATAEGKTYAATESVFDYLAQEVGLTNVTPEGYRNAAANESDPAPGDINEFQQALKDSAADIERTRGTGENKTVKINVLIYNAQTEGSVPEQIRQAANDGAVPVVEVTETVKPGTVSFVDWQLAQLQLLRQALDEAK